LYSSFVRGIDKVTLIAVWNGTGGIPKDRDALLTRHMVELMRDTGGKIETLNTSKYIYSVIDNALSEMINRTDTKPIQVAKTMPVAEIKRKK
jgi:hypothetical protein